MPPDSDRIETTKLLQDVARGVESARAALMARVYDELHAAAGRLMGQERRDHTLQPTALVNEAYLRLFEADCAFENKAHYLAIAATTMRRVLVDHARGHDAAKRGGHWLRVEMDEVTGQREYRDRADILALDEQLTKLAETDERLSRLVELKFFAGLSVEEIARTLGISTRTVENDWKLARAFLNKALSP